MTYGDALAGDERVEGSVPVMSSGGITGSHQCANTRGPVIVVGRKGSHGSVWWSDAAAFVIDTAYSIDGSNTVAELRWLYYVLKSLHLDSLSNDVGVPGLSREAAYEAQVPLVDREEQRRIADFLDDRVARIDQIITARHKQMASLESANSAFLQVMTERGHDEVRASGVSWMPLIGHDWRLPRVSQAFRTGSGSTPPTDVHGYFDGGVPWVNTGDVRDGPLSRTMRTVSPRALEDFSTLVEYPSGSLVVAMYGQGSTKGRVAILGTPACVNQACCVLLAARDLTTWAFHWFRAHKAAIVELAMGSGQPNLSQEILRGLRISVPPATTRQLLLAEISNREAATQGAVAALERQVELLQEYKQSLITAAVTGEIDVTTAGSGIPG